MDSSQALIVSGEGGIRWYDSTGGFREDPAGLSSDSIFFRLEDGTVGCLGDAGILVPGPGGLVALNGFSSEVLRMVGRAYTCAGKSLHDFYLTSYRDLYWIQAGEVHELTELPGRRNENSLALDRDGVLHIGTRSGVFLWEENELKRVLGFPDEWEEFRVSRGRAGTLLAWTDDAAWFRKDREWIHMGGKTVLFCGETPEGEIFVLTREYHLATGTSDQILNVWRKDAGVLVPRAADLVPGIEDLRFYGATESFSGLYVFTDRPSRVFRLAGNPRDGSWDLVAGPYDGRIEKLMILDDGSLLVFDGVRDHISLRRPH